MNDTAVPPITTRHPDTAPLTEREMFDTLDAFYAFKMAAETEQQLQQALAEATEHRKRLQVLLPETMDAAAIGSYTYPDGVVLATEHQVHCHVLKDRKMDVCGWLRGLGDATPRPTPGEKVPKDAPAHPLDLLECTMSVTFKVGEYAKARAFAKAAATCLGEESAPLTVTETWDVNTARLKAFIARRFVATGMTKAIHDGVQYFNQRVAFLRRPDAPAPTTDNPLD